MASKREGLRPVRPKSPPRQRKSNAERCKDYRTRVKADPARLANFKSTKSLAHAHWVARRTEEQKEIDKVNARLRQQNKRMRDKLHPDRSEKRTSAKEKPKTRSDITKEQAKREKARDRQRKRRANMSSRKKKIERDKQKVRYHQKNQASKESRKTQDDRAASDCTNQRVRYGRVMRSVHQKVKCRRDKASLGQLHFLKELIAGKTSILTRKNLYKRTTPRDTRVEDFYEQAALHLPGKNSVSTITMKAKKVLTKSVRCLFQEFQQENTQYKISLTSFSRRRPEHILLSSSRAFRQCLCQHCVNPMLKAEKLNLFLPPDLKIDHIDELCDRTLCPTPSNVFKRECVDRRCENCGVSQFAASLEGKIKEPETVVTWLKWEKTERSPMDQVKKRGTLRELLKELLQDLENLPTHLKTARWQRKQYQQLLSNLPEDSAVVTVDFAENYQCKFQGEVQSAYYSYRQISILPSVLQYHCTCSDVVTEYVVALSDDLTHDAAFGKKTLDDVLKHLEEKGVKCVHIFSDGCPSQFKSKLPFVHLTELTRDHPGLVIERHYFGSNHGKSLCDSSGGTVKGCATRAVVNGTEIIQSASDLHQFCSRQLGLPKQEHMNIHEKTHLRRSFPMYDHDQFERTTKSDDFMTLAGCRKIHDFKPTREVGEIVSRHLSCFCSGCKTSEASQCENEQFVGRWSHGTVQRKNRQMNRRKGKAIRCSGKRRAPSTPLSASPPSSPPVSPPSSPPASPLSPPPASPLPPLHVFPLTPSAVSPPSSEQAPEMTRNEFFKRTQVEFQNAVTFNELKECCRVAHQKILEWPILCEGTVVDTSCDESSLSIMSPEQKMQYFPVKVDADGNCLCRAISLLATGTEGRHIEMRVRLTAEMALNEELYTDAHYLRDSLSFQDGDADILRDATDFHGEGVITLLALFTEMPFDNELTANHPEEVFRMEVMAFRRRCISGGMWQLFAAANVLQWNIHSEYPPRGEVPIRQLMMNRIVRPRAPTIRHEAIMWTSNRELDFEYWISNHIIPLLPLVQHASDESAMPSSATPVDASSTNGPSSTTPVDASSTNGPSSATLVDASSTNGPSSTTPVNATSTNGIDIGAGKFILARIGATQGRRTIQKEYGAVVLQSQGNELEVRFLREKDGHYHFPEIEDDAWVDKENVVRNLDTSLLANRVLN